MAKHLGYATYPCELPATSICLLIMRNYLLNVDRVWPFIPRSPSNNARIVADRNYNRHPNINPRHHSSLIPLLDLQPILHPPPWLMLVASLGFGMSISSYTSRCHVSDPRLASVFIATILLGIAAGVVVQCRANTVALVVFPGAACVGMMVNVVWQSCALILYGRGGRAMWRDEKVSLV